MGPDETQFLILCVTSLATSAVSAVLGMAGGIMLLGVMLFFFDPIVAIPIHALIQLISNSSRTVIHFRSIRRDLLLPYIVLLLPAGFLALPLVEKAPADALRLAIGVFVLIATWKARWLLLGFDPERISSRPRFAILGGAAGFVGPLVGATGPLIAPFFLGLGLGRFELIGTKAACQAMGHVAKVILFGFSGFIALEYGWLALGMGVAAIVGTWLGTKVLHRVDDARFVQLYRLALTLVAVRLVISGLLAEGGLASLLGT
jgi:uncharacterized membrane protein YfcA